MKDNIKNIKAIIISITLVTVLLLTFAAIFFKLEVLNPTTYTKAFEENKIYSEIYEDIYTDINKYVANNNLPKGIFDDVISKSDVVEVVNNDIFSVVGYIKSEIDKVPVINLSVYESRLEESLNEYVESDEYKDYVRANYYNYDFEELDLDAIKDDILDSIKDKLVIIDNKTLADSAGIIKMSKYADLVDSGLIIIALIAAVFVLCGLYLPIWKKRKKRKFAWIGATIMISGLIMIIIGTVVSITGVYENIAVKVPYIATVIGFVIDGLLGKFRLVGVGMLAVGLLLASVYIKPKRKKNKEDFSLKIG